MTWFMRSKVSGNSDLIGSRTIPIPCRVLAQSASANADYETAIFSPLDLTTDSGFPGPGSNVGHTAPYTAALGVCKIMGAFIIPDSTITGGGAGLFATAKIRLYDDTGTLVGTLFSLLFTNSPATNATAFQPTTLGTAITTLRTASNLPNGFAIYEDETLTFEWLQSATTGLALPASVIVLDVV